MPPYAETLTGLFGMGFVLLHILLLGVFAYRIATGAWLPSFLMAHIVRKGLWYASALTISSFFLSLWYSDIVGLPVCALCWFSRTMMYPMAIILPIAALRGDRTIYRYVLPLSGVGALISGYQHLLQMGVVENGVCSFLQNAGNCAARYVFELGYITMPLFGFTVFLTVALLTWIVRERHV